MHKAGEEILASGYGHLVALSSYHVGEYPDREFITPGHDFVAEGLDFELEQENIEPWYQKVCHYKGFECKWVIQDGELQGAGIYVFFKDAVGADLCRQAYPKKN